MNDKQTNKPDEINPTIFPEPVDISAKLKRQFIVSTILTLFVGIAFGYFIFAAQAAAMITGK